MELPQIGWEVDEMDTITCSAFMVESKIFSGFSAEECLSLRKILNPVVKMFLKGETVCRDGDEIKYIGMIVQGKVNGAKFYRDGKSHLVHTFGIHDNIGIETIFSSKKRSPITYVAAEDTAIMLFPYSVMINHELIPPAYQLKIKDNIIRILADENIKSIYKLEVLSKKALRSRIMTFLCIMARKTEAKAFGIGMDREQFAQYLCVNRSALSYELSQMKREGLIDFQKDRFTIK